MKNSMIRILLVFVILILMGCGSSNNDEFRGTNEYVDVLERDAIKFFTEEVLINLKDITSDREDSKEFIGMKISSDNLYILDSICVWSAEAYGFDRPFGLTQFECYSYLSDRQKSLYNVATIEAFRELANDTFLIILSKPIAYEWGAYIDLRLYSQKKESSYSFIIVQRGNDMILNAIGSISSLNSLTQ